METTSTPTPQLLNSLHPVSAYLKQHERLLIVVFLILLSWFSFGKIANVISEHDHANLEQAKVVAAFQQEKNDALDKQRAQHDADTQALVAKIEARDAQLTQLQAQLVTALTKQQAVDKAMTPTELIQRWNVLVPEAGVSISNGQATLSPEGARATVVELEKAPALSQQLTAKTEELTNAQTLLTAEGQQVLDRDGLIAGLKAKATDDVKVCQEQIKVVKDEARKSKRRYLIVGTVIGAVLRGLVGHYTGL
jgi:hypothetical protein